MHPTAAFKAHLAVSLQDLEVQVVLEEQGVVEEMEAQEEMAEVSKNLCSVLRPASWHQVLLQACILPDFSAGRISFARCCTHALLDRCYKHALLGRSWDGSRALSQPISASSAMGQQPWLGGFLASIPISYSVATHLQAGAAQVAQVVLVAAVGAVGMGEMVVGADGEVELVEVGGAVAAVGTVGTVGAVGGAVVAAAQVSMLGLYTGSGDPQGSGPSTLALASCKRATLRQQLWHACAAGLCPTLATAC